MVWGAGVATGRKKAPARPPARPRAARPKASGTTRRRAPKGPTGLVARILGVTWIVVVAAAIGFLAGYLVREEPDPATAGAVRKATLAVPTPRPATPERAVTAPTHGVAATPAARSNTVPEANTPAVPISPTPPTRTAALRMPPAPEFPPEPERGSGALVAIVIDDVGVVPAGAKRVLALPAPITVAIMAYAGQARSLAGETRRRGHEVWMHVPMEPAGRADPGPDALLTNLAPAELQARLVRNLGRMEGYVGINNHMGSRFTTDPAGMAVVAAELKRRGLMFLDSRTSPRTVAESVARAAGVPTTARDVFLDNDTGAGRIELQLAQLEARARSHGTAVGIGHPHPETTRALDAWIPAARARGIELVPLSRIIRAREGARISYDQHRDGRTEPLPPPPG